MTSEDDGGVARWSVKPKASRSSNGNGNGHASAPARSRKTAKPKLTSPTLGEHLMVAALTIADGGEIVHTLRDEAGTDYDVVFPA